MSGRKADLQRLFAALARVKLANMAEKPNGASQDEMGRHVGTADVDRIWLDTMEDTISIVRAVFADHALFLLLCGAVFALQQDMLKAHGIDVRKVRTSREQARSTLTNFMTSTTRISICCRSQFKSDKHIEPIRYLPACAQSQRGFGY